MIELNKYCTFSLQNYGNVWENVVVGIAGNCETYLVNDVVRFVLNVNAESFTNKFNADMESLTRIIPSTMKKKKKYYSSIV